MVTRVWYFEFFINWARRPILYFNWKFSLCIHCKTKTNKKTTDFIKKIADFEILLEIEFYCRQIFEILIIHNPFLGSCEVAQYILARSFQPIWRLLETNKRTDTRTDNCKVYRYASSEHAYAIIMYKHVTGNIVKTGKI